MLLAGMSVLPLFLPTFELLYVKCLCNSLNLVRLFSWIRAVAVLPFQRASLILEIAQLLARLLHNFQTSLLLHDISAFTHIAMSTILKFAGEGAQIINRVRVPFFNLLLLLLQSSLSHLLLNLSFK